MSPAAPPAAPSVIPSNRAEKMDLYVDADTAESLQFQVRNRATSPSRFLQYAAYNPRTPIWTLCNPGNLCFLNSLLQNLARLPPLLVSLQNSEHDSRSAADVTPLASTFGHFCRKVNLDGSKSMRASKTTEAFHFVLPDLIAPFGSGRQRQQDAHEVLLRLIEKLDLEGRTAGLCLFNTFSGFTSERYGHPLPAICTGILEQQTTCSTCLNQSVQKEAFLCLSLPIPVQTEVSVECMMAAYFAEHEVRYRCSNCDGHSAVMQQRVGMWPTVLVVHFLRWRGSSKISTSIKVPTSLSFDADQSFPVYKLTGYILHHGIQANLGHYNAVVMISVNGSDEYFQVDDDLISSDPIRKSVYCKDGFPSTTCYLAFYMQVSK